MAIEVRPVVDDEEHRELLRVIAGAFGSRWTEPGPERRALDDRLRDRSRELAVFDAGRIVAGCFAYDLELTLPGGRAVPVAGLAGVAVDPTRTGEGLLRRVMAAHFDDARARGEAASVLLASESGIYRRFGYGWATSVAAYEATSSAAGLRNPPQDTGSLELVDDVATARQLAAQVYASVAARVAGTTSRSAAWWEVVFGSEDSWMGGGSPLAVVHRDRSGRPDGYLLYRLEYGDSRGHWVADATLVVRELVAPDLDVELALWQFATRVPLTRRVRLELAPVDLRLRWHLADPRQLRTVASHDLLWLRPLDLVPLVECRCYDSDGRIGFHLDAPGDPELDGTWTLQAAGGSAGLERGGSATVRFGLAVLASVLLGEARVSELAAAGLVSGDPESVALLSALWATEARPFTLSKF